MAYPNYYPVGYQQVPYQPVYQQMPQMPQYPQTQQANNQSAQSTPQVSISGMMWVNDEREASLYPVAPNTAVALWDSKSPVVYVKQADASGKPTLKVFDLAERVEETSGASQKPAPVSSFATKDELAVVVGAVKDVNGALASLRGDIDAMKGDMYGIAGKKKSAKKTVEENEDE